MELKPYQQKVISDLDKFLNYLKRFNEPSKAFNQLWEDKLGTYNPITKQGMEPYKDNIKGIPNVCLKVPTAGGKTFIACNAIKTIFDAYQRGRSKLVIWLVPSITILQQTLKNLKNPEHPYREKLNVLFNHKVEIFDKENLLQGIGFNSSAIIEQLNICILSFDSLRSKKKEDRKIYQENGNLEAMAGNIQDNSHVLEGTDETALINIIRALNPLIVVDESHNAQSDLSLEMLENLNPSFIMDLTATPRDNSNIVSYTNAGELKKENMVKLPVIVYNHKEKNEVVASAIQLRNKLEKAALEEAKKTGKYIRPIVLFQAQTISDKDSETFEKIREKLIELKIPKEEIKIKTAKIDEIKNIDLTAKECPVRYIITINALKEGWDCPFAYVLATLANRSSKIDVEQIVGRVLRQPYVKKHENDLLNVSYVLTSSDKFQDTLQSIVKGLNQSGFSEKDYRAEEASFTSEDEEPEQKSQQLKLKEAEPIDESIEELDIQNINELIEEESEDATSTINKITTLAVTQNREYDLQAQKINEFSSLPLEVANKIKSFSVKNSFKSELENLLIPQFHIKVSKTSLFGGESEDKLLEKDELLKDFKLSKENSDIDFDLVESDFYKIDLEEGNRGDYIPVISRFDQQNREYLKKVILTSPPEKKLDRITDTIMQLIGNMYPIPDNEIRLYAERVVRGFSEEQIIDFADNEATYTYKIKRKIQRLAKEYQEREFFSKLKIDNVFPKPSYRFKECIQPINPLSGYRKTLYEQEESNLNQLEKKVITELDNHENVKWWHRNKDRTGFCVNSFINFYPDFIVYTNSQKIILLETKGEHLDGSDSQTKIKVGNAWDEKAGKNFKYFMVFDQEPIDGAFKVSDFLKKLNEL